MVYTIFYTKGKKSKLHQYKVKSGKDLSIKEMAREVKKLNGGTAKVSVRSFRKK